MDWGEVTGETEEGKMWQGYLVMDPELGERQEGDWEKCGVWVRGKGKMESKATAPFGTCSFRLSGGITEGNGHLEGSYERTTVRGRQ